MIPATLGYVGFLFATRGGPSRAAAGPLPALAGVLCSPALVLAALLRASAASVAAVRETSVLIAAFLTAPLLGERVGTRLSRARLVGGVALIAPADPMIGGYRTIALRSARRQASRPSTRRGHPAVSGAAADERATRRRRARSHGEPGQRCSAEPRHLGPGGDLDGAPGRGRPGAA